MGVGLPSLVRWLSVRDVEKPMAPASTASRASSPIRAISSARRFAVGAAFAHDVDTQRPVGRLHGEVDVVLARFECGEEFGEGLPVPLRGPR